MRRIDVASVQDPACVELIARLERADMHVMLWDVTSDIGVPVVRAAIFDKTADEVFNPLSAALGFGCHPSRVVALTRALTEAAQSRLTAISGSRDDQSRFMYRSAQSAGALAYFRKEASERGTVDFRSLPTRAGDTIEGDLRHVIDRLAAAGLSRVAVVDLSRPDLPISVARVVVPGLEGPSESPLYVPGPRARAARS